MNTYKNAEGYISFILASTKNFNLLNLRSVLYDELSIREDQILIL